MINTNSSIFLLYFGSNFKNDVFFQTNDVYDSCRRKNIMELELKLLKNRNGVRVETILKSRTNFVLNCTRFTTLCMLDNLTVNIVTLDRTTKQNRERGIRLQSRVVYRSMI